MDVGLVNTGWAGGAYGSGERIKLKYSRAIVDAINTGKLKDAPSITDPRFGFEIITQCPDVPSDILQPQNAWSNQEDYVKQANDLVERFENNFNKNYINQANDELKSAMPKKIV